MGIERAQHELTLHPENPRPAYLGASALLELGELDRVAGMGVQSHGDRSG